MADPDLPSSGGGWPLIDGWARATLSPGGASGIGIGNVAGNGVPQWTLDLGSSLRASHHGGFNN